MDKSIEKTARMIAFGRGLRGMRGALGVAGLVCCASCSSFAGDRVARPPLTPEESVRTFYSLLADGQCDQAIALRPEYKRERCADFELVALKDVEERVQVKGTALVSLDLEYRLAGTAARARGCVLLRLKDGAWRYRDYRDSDCLAVAKTIMQTASDPREPPKPAVSPGGVDPAPAPTQAAIARAGVAMPPGPPSGPAPAPERTAPGPRERPPVLAPAVAEGEPGPVDTLIRYYEALDSHDCETVRQLRPDYKHCETIESATLSDVHELMGRDEAGVAAIAYRATFSKRAEPQTQPEGGAIDGIAWMEKRGGAWKLIQVYDQSQAGEVKTRYAQALAADPSFQEPADAAHASPPLPDASLPDLALLEPRPGPLQPELAAPGDRLEAQPTTAACSALGDLRGNPSEKRIRSGLPPDRSGPPRYLIERAEVARGELPGGTRGSIRWVDLDDPNGLVVALTFDLCEQADEVAGYDPGVVDYLREQGIRATFYAGGKWMRSHRERAKQLMMDPLFEVGNHAWTHGNMRVLKGQEMRDQILWTQAQYLELRDEIAEECASALDRIPAVPSTFRFPYGTCSKESLDALERQGLTAVQWNIVTGDPARGQTAEGIANKILKGLKPGRGSIVVMHANGRGFATAQALRKVIPKLLERNYRFVTASELLQMGRPHSAEECFEETPGDNARYDKLFGKGTGG